MPAGACVQLLPAVSVRNAAWCGGAIAVLLLVGAGCVGGDGANAAFETGRATSLPRRNAPPPVACAVGDLRCGLSECDAWCGPGHAPLTMRYEARTSDTHVLAGCTCIPDVGF